MTETEQQIALCQWAGWKVERIDDGEFLLIDPSGTGLAADWEPGTTLKSFLNCLPDTNSLDVLAEFEGKLDATVYGGNLFFVLNRNGKLRHAFQLNTQELITLGARASVEERREAILRTLGLWKE